MKQKPNELAAAIAEQTSLMKREAKFALQYLDGFTVVLGKLKAALTDTAKKGHSINPPTILVYPLELSLREIHRYQYARLTLKGLRENQGKKPKKPIGCNCGIKHRTMAGGCIKCGDPCY